MKITIFATCYAGKIGCACPAGLRGGLFCVDVDQAQIDSLHGVFIYEQG